MTNINFMAPITPTTGYGVTSTNIFKELHKKYNVSIFPIGNASAATQEEANLLNTCIEKTNTSFCNKAPFLKIWHPHDLATRVGTGRYGALIFFETDKLRENEVYMLNQTDCVFVASEWGKQVLIDNKVTTEIYISPLAVDTEIFNQEIKVDNTDRPYRFINIGKWEIRKGHDVLVEAFNKAFNKEDNVELLMLNDNPFLNEAQHKSWQGLYKNSNLGEKIHILPRVQTQQDLAKIIQQADCGIFPARAEGWNNEILEVMAMNKPIITTNYSAHTEYCNEDNAYLISVDKLTKAKDDMFFANSVGDWADLGKNQIDQMVSYMRETHEKGVKENTAGLETVKKYTWENTANQITKGLLKEV